MTDTVAPEMRAHQLLGACADIETELTRRLGPSWRPPRGRKVGLGTYAHALRDAGDRQVARYLEELLAYAKLRNAIAHDGYRGGEPIATPLPETIASVMRLRDELLHPTTVNTFAHAPVTAQASDPLDRHLPVMVAQDYSQLPVYDHEEYLGLLTTNAIARWVGAHLSETIMDLGVDVAEVVKHTEAHERVEFVAHHRPAFEACQALTAAEDRATVLLVTHNGRAGEGLLGVLTAADVPTMLAEVSIPSP